jgi:hypothetical protein
MNEPHFAQMKGGIISENYLFTLCAFSFGTTVTHHHPFRRIKNKIIWTSFISTLFKLLHQYSKTTMYITNFSSFIIYLGHTVIEFFGLTPVSTTL